MPLQIMTFESDIVRVKALFPSVKIVVEKVVVVVAEERVASLVVVVLERERERKSRDEGVIDPRCE